MLKFRLKLLIFSRQPMPAFGTPNAGFSISKNSVLSAHGKNRKSWDQVPEKVKTHLRNWHPEAERKFLGA